MALYKRGDGQDWMAQALRQSEERYDLAMEAIREGVYDWNIETGDIYNSPRVAVVLGFSPEEIRSVQDWVDRIHPDDTERYTSTLIAHLKGKSERFQCEYRFRGKAGEWRWARHHGIALRSDTGRAYRMAGSIGDITERKRIEETLRQSCEMLKAVVDAVPAMISVKDSESRYAMMNRYQAEIVGVSQAEAIGKTAVELQGHEYGAYTRRLDEKVFESGEALPYFEENYPDTAGRPHTWLTTKAPLKDEHGRVRNVVSVALDITERKQAAAALLEHERRYRELFENSPIGIWEEDYSTVKDMIGQLRHEGVRDFGRYFREHPETLHDMIGAIKLLNVNQAALDIYRAPNKDQLVRVLAESARGPDALTFYEAELSALAEGKTRVVIESEDRAIDGETIALRTISYIEDAYKDDWSRLISTVEDVTDRKWAEAALRESEQRFRNIVTNVPGAIFRRVHTPEGTVHFSFLSDAYKELFHHDPKGLMADSSALRHVIHPEDFEQLQVAVKRSVEHLEAQDVEYRIVTPEGQTKWVRAVAQPRRVENGDIVCDGIALDITNQKEAEQQVEHLAYYDQMTGLPNRSLFVDRVSQAITASQRDDRNLCVLSLGLDRFSTITATFGHAAGDGILRESAERLNRCLRDSDTVARGSGDTFLILLARLRQVEDVTGVLQKIHAVFEPPVCVEGHDHDVTVSIGVAVHPGDGTTPDALLRSADIAHHQATTEAPGSDRFYAAGMNDRVLARLSLEQGLRRALEREEFVLHYQPQVELRHGRVVGVEALVRWQHPNGRLVPPGDFIPLAEETGLIVPLGEWVLRNACLQARKWQDSGMPAVSMAVNISGQHLHDGSIVDTVRRTLADTGLSPDRLKLELTESSLMDDVEGTVEVMEAFRTMGVRLAVDDFGTGYSSLSYLSRFPIETLKIDRSFVITMTTDPDNATIVDAIMSLAHGLNMKVIAEGVDATEQLTYLRAYRCNVIQGFIASPPVPADEIPGLVEQGFESLAPGAKG